MARRGRFVTIPKTEQQVKKHDRIWKCYHVINMAPCILSDNRRVLPSAFQDINLLCSSEFLSFGTKIDDSTDRRMGKSMHSVRKIFFPSDLGRIPVQKE
ncbi:hypothetical protein TNIN_478991 [Trichonephila inaurata madagascariensis]|uniref:Uncharacterized protein n=1 Tax=Trichonephila inaurata madagascariensis TaxID=2747483 RepID=A0A8X7BYS2_9ARAC|nr:hypothetical protein TNIN_478991 [Trichonephila inaurata madagascariensis]